MPDIAGLPFGIGSMPHKDVRKACAAVLDIFPRSPFWPELPRRDWRESLGVEQGRGLPGFSIDEATRTIYFEAERDISAELERFYGDFLNGDSARYAVSAEFIPGFEAMLEAIDARGVRPAVLKGQLTGPTTLGLILKDRGRKALLYNDQIMDVLVKATIMKASWMAETMAGFCDHPVVFFDEPMLQSIGSAAIPIDREVAVGRLREIVEGVDCVTGGHCCGNTDWSILIEGGIDIIAFDSWQFAETLALYPEALRDFIGRGGLVAWGAIPASSEGAKIATDRLYAKLLSAIDHVAQSGAVDRDAFMKMSLVTPSCGLGSLTEVEAENILAKTAELADMIASA